MARGKPHKAIKLFGQSLVISKELDDRRGEGQDSHNLAGELSKVDCVDEAVKHAVKAVAIYEEIEHPDLDKARARLEELRKQAD